MNILGKSSQELQKSSLFSASIRAWIVRMPDPVHDLYQSQIYPAMSHPRTDPAVTAVAASLAGLNAPDPSQANILEIGCASGLNLLPLAARWPQSRFTGIDFSRPAIDEARELARRAGLTNVELIEADVKTFDPGEGISYDFIISHGIYSWVPGEVRQALLDFCANRLSPQGTAMISFNTLPGWSLRKSIAGLARNISDSPASVTIGHQAEEILASLIMAAGTRTSYSRHLNRVLHDMLGHGGHFLSFDDFSPVNEPCTFLDFVSHTGRSGLHYLGESRVSEDRPASLPPEARDILDSLTGDPHLIQQTIDLLTNRTFRHALLCRADAAGGGLTPRPKDVLKCSVRCAHTVGSTTDGTRLLNPAGEELARMEHPLAVAFFSTLSKHRAESLPFHEIIVHMAEFLDTPFDIARDLPVLAGLALGAARSDFISLRSEPVRFDPTPSALPDLGPLRLAAATMGLPLVDAYHVPCPLDDETKRQLAVAMDGSKSAGDLADLARLIAPGFNFPAWLKHLAARGMFAG